MAEPTEEQKLAAAKAALAKLNVDDTDEARRVVAIYWSQKALEPERAKFVPAFFGALIAAGDNAPPEIKDRIEWVNKEAMAITRLLADWVPPTEEAK